MPKPVNKQKKPLAHQSESTPASTPQRETHGKGQISAGNRTCLTGISEGVVAEARRGFRARMNEATVPAETTLTTGKEFTDLCHDIDLSPTDE